MTSLRAPLAACGVLAAGLVAWMALPSLSGSESRGQTDPPESPPPTAASDPGKPGVGSWNQFRGDLLGTGISHSPRPKYQGRKWKYFAAQSMTTAPAVAKGNR